MQGRDAPLPRSAPIAGRKQDLLLFAEVLPAVRLPILEERGPGVGGGRVRGPLETLGYDERVVVVAGQRLERRVAFHCLPSATSVSTCSSG